MSFHRKTFFNNDLEFDIHSDKENWNSFNYGCSKLFYHLFPIYDIKALVGSLYTSPRQVINVCMLIYS